MINILLFDQDKITPEQANEVFLEAKKVFEDDTLICLPYGMSWIQDYPVSQLKNFRDYLTALIDRTEVIENNDL